MHLADEFYLIAHQDSTGKPRLQARPAGHGAAAALLAELYLLDRLTIDEHGVTVTSAAPIPDPLAHNIMDRMLGSPAQLAVHDWLAVLAPTAVQDVADRLTRQGLLEKVEAKRPWGNKQWHVPVSMNEAAWPYARITSRLIAGPAEPLTLPDQILAGLCHATGLTRQMLWGEEQPAARRYLAQVIGELPAPMRALVTETRIALRGRADDLA
jgi:hypothetical protein